MPASLGDAGSAECALGLADRPDVLMFPEVNLGYPVFHSMCKLGLDASLIAFDEYGEVACIYRNPFP